MKWYSLTTLGFGTFLAMTACLASGQESSPAMGAATELRRYATPEGNQGVAADGEFLYAIGSHALAKYRRDTGERTATWTGAKDGAIHHLNAGVVVQGKLYCAHSNFPKLPMQSSVEIWDANTLTHVGRHDFGQTDGSLTWIAPRDQFWFACFVYYGREKDGAVAGKGPGASRVVKYDADWKPLAEWKFPPEVIERFGVYSSSCGAFGPQGYLYVTGHTEKELYVLEIPRTGTALKLKGIIPVPFEGQAFNWDPLKPDILFGIVRKSKETVMAQIPNPAF